MEMKSVEMHHEQTHVAIPSIASGVGEFDCEAGYPKEDQTRAYLPIMLVRTKTQVTIAQRALAVQRRSDTSNRSQKRSSSTKKKQKLQSDKSPVS
eukprot:436585_1